MSVNLRDPRTSVRRIFVSEASRPRHRLIPFATGGMTADRLARAFASVGARLKVLPPRHRVDGVFIGPRLVVDVDVDRVGSFFFVRTDPRHLARIEVLDVCVPARCVLLRAGEHVLGPRARRVLCGFVNDRAGVRWLPDHPGARDVGTARAIVCAR